MKQTRPLLKGLAWATALGLLAAGWLTVIEVIQGEEASFIDTLTYVIPFFYLWAVFALPVVWLAKNRPIERGMLVSRSAMHLGLALLISVAHTTLQLGFLALLSAQSAPEHGLSLGYLVALVTFETPLHLVIYGAVLGVTYVVGYKRRLRERELATTQLSEQLALAQVRALRMQINPHFLFNAMNSISMLVRDRKQEAAVKTIAGLSDLLRYVLDDATDQEVPLGRELDFIERYLAIEKIRFPDRLEVSIEVAEDTLDALVPNLVLQPLVENAIRHGVSKSAAATTIAISASKKDEVLRLTVTDDGPGITEGSPHRDGAGLGIANTRERLAQLYGEDGALEMDGRLPSGTAVQLSLPFHTTPVMNGDRNQ